MDIKLAHSWSPTNKLYQPFFEKNWVTYFRRYVLLVFYVSSFGSQTLLFHTVKQDSARAAPFRVG